MRNRITQPRRADRSCRTRRDVSDGRAVNASPTIGRRSPTSAEATNPHAIDGFRRRHQPTTHGCDASLERRRRGPTTPAKGSSGLSGSAASSRDAGNPDRTGRGDIRRKQRAARVDPRARARETAPAHRPTECRTVWGCGLPGDDEEVARREQGGSERCEPRNRRASATIPGRSRPHVWGDHTSTS